VLRRDDLATLTPAEVTAEAAEILRAFLPVLAKVPA
jgi:hypothetical protein